MSKKKTNIGGRINLDFSLANTVVPLAKPIIDTANKQINESAEAHRQLIPVPELYSKGFPLTVEQSIKLLEEKGFTYELISLTLNDACEKYRNCFDLQVIETLPSAKQKAKPGSRILVKYITQEVIDKSIKIFEENEERRAKRKEETSKAMTSTVDAAKRGFRKISSVFGKKEKEDVDE